MTDVNYISAEGLQRLKEEVLHRKNVLRKEISEAIGVAKEQGDLSENFEYQDAKERQGTNEVKIANLEHKILNSVIVEAKSGGSNVTVGNRFTVELENGEQKSFEMSGSTESDPLVGKISNESPIGNAFLGAAVGETVKVEVPSGTKIYKIISID